MTRSLLHLVVLAAAAAGMSCGLPRDLVERRYSSSIYPVVQHFLTSASNLVAFSLFDVLIAAAVTCWVLLAWRDGVRARTRAHAAARIALRSVLWCAAFYLIFLASWGLNYRRVPLREKLSYDESRVTSDAARAAARAAGDRLNSLHSAAHAAGWVTADAVDPALATAFGRAAADVRLPTSTVPGRPKLTLFDWYFRRSGTDGMTDPFFLETLVASNLLAFERPFVVAHEWSHLAGIGDEGEANFLGWLTCMRGGPAAQYSGFLFLYRELSATVTPRERATLAAALAPGPRADLREIRGRYEREINPRLSAAGWRIYDTYLRANHVEAGAASYADVVKLVLGVRLTEPSPLP